MAATTLSPPFLIPLTEAPAQVVTVTLGGQACTINLYTKSINVPVQPPGTIPTDPDPTYENTNPVFLDLYVAGTLIVGGVILRNEALVVINQALGFVGDLAIIDTIGNEDPVGVPTRLPPEDLRNDAQRQLPLSLAGIIPVPPGNTIPGLGTRWQLTYWPNLR